LSRLYYSAMSVERRTLGWGKNIYKKQRSWL
jgi:hypothetical protein